MKVYFNESVGRVKPMHAVNNGPVVPFKNADLSVIRELHPFRSNLNEYKNAGIPFARTHDASFYHRWGQEHVIDVYYIFPNFDADPEDPANYDFTLTDAYVRGCVMAGTEVFYRLGHRIEHEIKKYGIHPPKDPEKWAVICEHIVRHYTKGWANGFHYKMPYWEIWCEPDLHWDKPQSVSPTWSGTKEQYFELYHVTATHLKERYPHLKFGGPGLSDNLEWAELFLAQLKAPLDFFSWHCYYSSTDEFVRRGNAIRELLDRYGFTDTESIMDEWNYIRSWDMDDTVYRLEKQGTEKSAAFEVATMCTAHACPIDMIMYYDARPNEFWNGLFDCRVIGRVLKGYYPFPMFNTLYRLGTSVRSECNEEGGYICAARNEDEAAVILSHYSDDDSTETKIFSLDLSGFSGENGVEVEYYLLDETHNCELVGRNTYFGDRLITDLILPIFTSYLIKIKKK